VDVAGGQLLFRPALFLCLLCLGLAPALLGLLDLGRREIREQAVVDGARCLQCGLLVLCLVPLRPHVGPGLGLSFLGPEVRQLDAVGLVPVGQVGSLPLVHLAELILGGVLAYLGDLGAVDGPPPVRRCSCLRLP